MTIYQLHKYSDNIDRFRDYIIGSYLRKERAEEEKAKAEAKEKDLREHGKRCINCPFIEFEPSGLQELLAEYPDYCSEAKLEETEYGIKCDNYYIHWKNAFKIEELEVEE